MKLRLHRFELPLRHVFTIARGSMSVCRTLIVELEEDGVSGYGEAGENPYYHADLDNMTAALEGVRADVESHDLADPPAACSDPIHRGEAGGGEPHECGYYEQPPAALWEELRPRLAGNTFAQAALDAAAWDLWGKLRGEPVWRLWGLSLDAVPPSDYTIGIDSIDVMIAKMEEFPGWPVYKIKLGTPEDIEIVRRLRAETDAAFRVDANCGWTAEQTIRNAAALADLGVEYIEQPLPPGDPDAMREVYARSVLPLVADESCRLEADVDACRGQFHGVNVKLVKCGGLTPARRMLLRARELGMKTMIGCMTESSVGISAVAQLLPLVDYADLDGALLLAEDCASGVTVDRGRASFPEENGCGVTML